MTREEIITFNKLIYYNNPNKCKHCGKIFPYNLRNRKFCCKSCACTYNNYLRAPRTYESRQKISKALKGRKYTEERRLRQHEINIRVHSKPPKITICPICGNEFSQKSYGSKKTCNNNCRITYMVENIKGRSYPNGHKKLKIVNNNGIDVLLESSWEIKTAELLDFKKIIWIRPKPMEWFDSNGKRHLYFSDFYLPKYDVYLDPKNPYCMSKDKEKMNYFKDKIKLIAGHLSVIELYINALN